MKPIQFAILSLAWAANGQAAEYQVTVENLMKSQPLSPPVLATQKGDARPVEVGEPANPEVQAIAEEGATAPLAALLLADPRVAEVLSAEGPVLPGGKATFKISSKAGYSYLSTASMLGTTNDGFIYPLMHLPAEKSAFLIGSVYDAGTEVNSELCAFIPGPPCGSHNAHDPAKSEGVVSPHDGILGVGDLVPGTHGWSGYVARITIECLS